MSDEEFAMQYSLDDLPACKDGMALLKRFAETYPTVYAFVRPEDFLDLHNDAFVGMPEWDAFAQHCGACTACHES